MKKKTQEMIKRYILYFPMTLGQFTIYFSILLILLQAVILGIGV